VVSTDITDADTRVTFMEELAQLDSKLHQNKALVAACCCVPDRDCRRNIADVLQISSKIRDELPARDPVIPARTKPYKPQDTTQDAKSYSDTFNIPPSPPLSVSDIISRYSSNDGELVDRLESLKSATSFIQAREKEIFEHQSYFESLNSKDGSELYPCIDCVDEVDDNDVPPVPPAKASPTKVLGKLRSWTRMGVDRAQSGVEDTDGLDGVEGPRKSVKRRVQIRATLVSRWRRFSRKPQDTPH